MEWATLLASSALGALADHVPDIPLFGLKGFVSKLTDAIVAASVWLLRRIAQSLLLMLLWMLEPLTFQTPAVATPISNVDNVVVVEQLIDPESGIIPRFQQLTLRISTSLLSAGVLISFLMLGMGIFPRVGDAAKANLARLLPAGIFAYFVPTFAQLIIEVAQAGTNMVYGMGNYDELVDELWLGLIAPPDFENGDNELGLLVGMIVASVALLFVVLELAARIGIIILIASIAPLVSFAYAFNFTRGFATKATQFFVSTVFFQFFVAIGVTIMLHAMAAFQANPDTSTIPAWAMLAGIAITIATFPKILSGANQAIDAATAPAKKALMATAAVGAIGAAAAAKTTAKTAGGLARMGAGALRDSQGRSGQALHRVLSKGSVAARKFDQGRINTLGRKGGLQLWNMTKDASGLGGLTPHSYDDIGLGPRRQSRGGQAAGKGGPNSSAPPGTVNANPSGTTPASPGSAQPISTGLATQPSKVLASKPRPPPPESVTQSRSYRLGAAAGNLIRRRVNTAARGNQSETGGTTHGVAHQSAVLNVMATQSGVDAIQTTAKNLQKSRDGFDKQVGKSLARQAEQWNSAGATVQKGVDAMRRSHDPRAMARIHANHRRRIKQEARDRVQQSPKYQSVLQRAQSQEGGLAEDAQELLLSSHVERDETFQQQATALDSAFETTAQARGIQFAPQGDTRDRTYQVDPNQRGVSPTPHAAQRRHDALRAVGRVAQPRLADGPQDIESNREAALQLADGSLRGEIHQLYGRSNMDLAGYAPLVQQQARDESPDVQQSVQSALGDLALTQTAIRNAPALPREQRRGGLRAYTQSGAEGRQEFRVAIRESAIDRRVERLRVEQPSLGYQEARQQVESEQAEKLDQQLAPIMSSLDHLDEAAGLSRLEDRLVQTHAALPALDADGLHASVREATVRGGEAIEGAQRRSSVEDAAIRARRVAADPASVPRDPGRRNTWSRQRAKVVSANSPEPLQRRYDL